eukprot:4743513-Pleurochrysis_carterae.AAC.2
MQAVDGDGPIMIGTYMGYHAARRCRISDGRRRSWQPRPRPLLHRRRRRHCRQRSPKPEQAHPNRSILIISGVRESADSCRFLLIPEEAVFGHCRLCSFACTKQQEPYGLEQMPF